MKDYDDLIFIMIIMVLMIGGLWFLPDALDGQSVDDEDIRVTTWISGFPISF